MRLKIRFSGATGILAGASEVFLNLDKEPTVKEVLAIVDQKYLKHQLLDKGGKVVYPCIIAIDGKMMRNRAIDLYERLKEGTTVSILPPPAGG